MSLRRSPSQASLPTSHYFITVARGEKMRTLSVRPAVLFGVAGLLAIVGLWYLVATLYLVFRDEMLAALVAGETQMQYAYEDRLAEMRTQIDKVTSRQLLDQTSFEGKVHALLSRQAQLETRAQLVSALSNEVRGMSGVASPRGRDDALGAIGSAAPELPASVPAGLSSYAPSGSAFRLGGARPRPDAFADPESGPRIGPTSDASGASVATPAARALATADRSLPVPLRLGLVAESLDHVESAQMNFLASIDRTARATAARLETAFGEAGLRPERFGTAKATAAGIGGPFVPLPSGVGETPFEARIRELQAAVSTAGRLKRLLPVVPLRRPVPASAEITSGFGGRVDPFNGRIAMHTGIDFGRRQGASVHATAAGRVSIAGSEGGYGNMIEINHGNGLATRYGHLSAIFVVPGQWVDVGSVVGEVGSTGRSTGPHLHYETRVDGEAVDPIRFLRAGQRLFAAE